MASSSGNAAGDCCTIDPTQVRESPSFTPTNRRRSDYEASMPPAMCPLHTSNRAATLALLGPLEEARAAAQAGLALDPSFTIRRYQRNLSSDNQTFLAKRERIDEGMRMAGVLEG